MQLYTDSQRWRRTVSPGQSVAPCKARRSWTIVPRISVPPSRQPLSCTHKALAIIAVLVFIPWPALVFAAGGDAGPSGTTPSLPKSSLPTATTAVPTSAGATEAGPATPAKATTKQTKKIKANSSKNKVTSSGSSSSQLSSPQAAFVRRIQSEWRSAIQMGIAYDWVKGKPVKPNKKKGKRKEQAALLADADVAPKTTMKKDDSQNDQTADNQHLCLGPLGRNMFVWHFSIRGMDQSVYDRGIYHGRLILPPEYPSKPPRVQVWTPSGRFQPRADICLSASAFHPESWNPGAWNLRTIVESLRLHFLTPPTEIGGMKSTPEEREELAKESRKWRELVPLKSAKTREQYILVDHAEMIKQGRFANKGSNYPRESTPDTLAATHSPHLVSREDQPQDDAGVELLPLETEKEFTMAVKDVAGTGAAEEAAVQRKRHKKKKKEKPTQTVNVRVTKRASHGPLQVIVATLMRMLRNPLIRAFIIGWLILRTLFHGPR